MADNTITLPEDQWTVDSLGKKIPQKALIQFVQGTVAAVQIGEDNPVPALNSNDLGVIWALPSTNKIGIKKETTVRNDDRFRYQPLLRGMQDIPNLGDPVLLCEFGGKKYYLGPLNTDNNPNINVDSLRVNQVHSGKEQGNLKDSSNKSSMVELPGSVRLGKRLNIKLDNPIMHQEELMRDEETGEDLGLYMTPDAATQYGDMIFEGRHGNSLRIGSRNINPYIFLSNGRAVTNAVESSLDGSIMAMIEHGSIRDHFMFDTIEREVVEDGELKQPQILKYNFTLADDDQEKVYRSASKTFTTSLGRGLGPKKEEGGKESGIDDVDINKTIYDYNNDQVFINSGRLMFNARDEDIFMTSHKFIHFGSGNNINMSTGNTLLVEAATSMVVNTPMFKVNAPGKVYIDGRKNPIDEKTGLYAGSIFLGNPLLGDHLQPAVMGDGLVTFLTSLIVEIQAGMMAVAEAIGVSGEISGPAKVMNERVKALDQLLGTVSIKDEDLQESYDYPKNIADVILSNSVRIKK